MTPSYFRQLKWRKVFFESDVSDNVGASDLGFETLANAKSGLKRVLVVNWEIKNESGSTTSEPYIQNVAYYLQYVKKFKDSLTGTTSGFF